MYVVNSHLTFITVLVKLAQSAGLCEWWIQYEYPGLEDKK